MEIAVVLPPEVDLLYAASKRADQVQGLEGRKPFAAPPFHPVRPSSDDRHDQDRDHVVESHQRAAERARSKLVRAANVEQQPAGPDEVAHLADGGLQAREHRPGGDGLVSPWPWTLGSPSGRRFFDSREQARTALAAMAARGRDVAAGLLQVSLKRHGHRVGDPATLLDPGANLGVLAIGFVGSG